MTATDDPRRAPVPPVPGAQAHLPSTRSRTRVKGQGVGLYLLWPPGMQVEGSIRALPVIAGYPLQIGLWSGLRLVWRPPQAGGHPDWLSEDELTAAWQALVQHAAGLTVQPADGSLVGETPQPAYRIFHVERLRAQVPREVLAAVRRQRRRAQSQRDLTSGDPAIWAQQAALGRMLDRLEVANVDPRTGWSPGYFSHYERTAHQRGWIVIAPDLAVVAGANSQEVTILASLLQPRDVAVGGGSQGGILAERFEVVLGRVAQWNGTQDVFEAVSQLEALFEGGRESTDGQVWLNFALAAIGVILTLFEAPRLGNGQVVPLGLLAVASVFFALYARSGHMHYQVVGWAAFAAAVAVALAVLAGVHLPIG